jgi:hypothetical protein
MLKTVAYLLIIFSIQIFVGCETTVIEPLQMRPSTIEIENKYRFLVPNQKIALVIEGDGDGKTTITSSNPEIISCDTTGSCMLTAGKIGKAIITIAKSETSTHSSASLDLELIVTHKIPLIIINTEGNQPITSKDTYFKADFSVLDSDNPRNNIEKTGFKDEIRGRGNYSWVNSPKKSYRIKFDKKTSLFGLEAAKNWILLANYHDPTLIMNAIAFELANRFKMKFSHHFVHVDVILNGEYIGNYLLTEHNQVGDGRVAIDKTNGFLVELDKYYDEEPKFTTDYYELPVMIKSPEYSQIEGAGYSEEYSFVREKFNTIEALLINNGEVIPDNTYKSHIDLQSMVDFILINELVKNSEIGHPKSVFMHMDKDKIVRMGPLWDFDWTFDSAESEDQGIVYFSEPQGLIWKHDFFLRFFSDPEFIESYKKRWNEMKSETVDMENFMDQMKQKLELSHRANATTWNLSVDLNEEIEKMKQWWKARISFLDGEINKL